MEADSQERNTDDDCLLNMIPMFRTGVLRGFAPLLAICSGAEPSLNPTPGLLART